ncbi:MAG: serine hydrolase [Hydrogenophaga sp.]|uniref:serine hydrolase n=1 Tax=Hydrogenophaga sp. TaxID=1904254 RepID=UPI0025BD02F9|nr:serine hydrolase [Hydrogenophaga sp.]MBT9549623.1 serine hydrolase [Hydrogenophaga sp.]
MKPFRTRLFTLLQFVAAAVTSAALLLPLSAEAAVAKKLGAKAKKPAATHVVERKKRVVAKAAPSRRGVAVATKGRKQDRIDVKLAKAEFRGSKRLGSGRKNASTQIASARKPERSTRATRARVQKNDIRLVAHRSPAHVMRMLEEPRLSNGERLGLRAAEDPLALNSSVALVVDQQTNEVLFSKNDSAVLPIASLTKLMTGLVITDANLSMDEPLTITQDDVDTFKNSRSRLAVGSTLTRGELMHLALMSSENRAAHALGRTYPGGLDSFVRLMNSKARELGMRDTRYVEPTGLSSLNQSSARDLATLVSAAYQSPILRSLSTSPSHQLELGHRVLEFKNSNRLIRNPDWEIGLQKTGYISEAGRCLVMQAKVAGRQLIMVFLDSAGKLSRAQDAERVRRWVEAQPYPQAAVRPQG